MLSTIQVKRVVSFTVTHTVTNYEPFASMRIPHLHFAVLLEYAKHKRLYFLFETLDSNRTLFFPAYTV
jgi:hypothetical protein